MTHFVLRVAAAFANDQVTITVEDNGIGIRDAELDDLNSRLNEPQSGQEITGLINIHKRLRLMFGSGSGLAAARSELGGLRVTIVIKLRPGGES